MGIRLGTNRFLVSLGNIGLGNFPTLAMAIESCRLTSTDFLVTETDNVTYARLVMDTLGGSIFPCEPSEEPKPLY